MIKTFRGILDDGGQVRIRLSTKKGKIGYKIVKFELMPEEPGDSNQESICKLFKIVQATVTGDIDFSDGNLLAAGHVGNATQTYYYPPFSMTIFEQEIFNQDIYITHQEKTGSARCNYYLELETHSLSDNAAAVSTLRDIRITENTT